jgi:hypothetical protein
METLVMNDRSRWIPRRSSVILGSLILVAPLVFLGISRAQTPQWPASIIYNSNNCPLALALCRDCAAVGAGPAECQFARPAAGWTMQSCQPIVGLGRCEETFFDCGTKIDCVTGFPVGGNCANSRWCR